jgi:hypothetical protein
MHCLYESYAKILFDFGGGDLCDCDQRERPEWNQAAPAATRAHDRASKSACHGLKEIGFAMLAVRRSPRDQFHLLAETIISRPRRISE